MRLNGNQMDSLRSSRRMFRSASCTSVRCLRQLGFTLLELMVVVAIIAGLAALVGPRYFNQLSKSERQLAKAQIESLARALDAYRLDTGSYPTSADGLAALMASPGSARGWNGPYLQKGVPLDPWGEPFHYVSPGRDGRDYELASLGKNRAPGGTGDDEDIGFWDKVSGDPIR